MYPIFIYFSAYIFLDLKVLAKKNRALTYMPY